MPIPFPDRLVASCDGANSAPFLTIAIPHYNWRRHLEVVLASLFEQDEADFEIVVSDNCSEDDSRAVIPGVLERSGRRFRYYTQASNLGYDGNVRFCLAASTGRYVLLLGNDDTLNGPDVVRRLRAALTELRFPDVAFTNFEDWSAPGSVVHRAVATRELGAGPDAAARFFRSFSFVSGLIFDREAALEHETARWDGSIYYQIYLACRVLAAGGRLGSVAISAVRKDVKLDGQGVTTYATRLQAAPRSFASRHTGLDMVIRVTADAVLPLVPERARSGVLRRLVSQVYGVTYPFWLMEYRRVGRWSHSVGVARSMWPARLLREYPLSAVDRAALWSLYAASTSAGLTIPGAAFDRVKARLAGLLRRRQQTAAAPSATSAAER